LDDSNYLRSKLKFEVIFGFQMSNLKEETNYITLSILIEIN